ncbi:MAG: sialidase family protein [Planctomycetota bacterium]
MRATWLCVAIGVVCSMSEGQMKELIIVANGKGKDVCLSDPWRDGDGFLEGTGDDAWLLADRGLGKGDLLITARLAIRKLGQSAARFSFNCGESSFGFEGSHGKIYLTGIFFKGKGTTGALGDPGEAGVIDGKPFAFEVIRKSETLTVRINGKDVHHAAVKDEEIESFGFDPRRAVVQIEQFSATGSFLSQVYTPGYWDLWFDPRCCPVQSEWRGPFVNLPDDSVLTVVNSDGGVRAFASKDDGKTWQPRGFIKKEGQTFKIRDGNGDTLLLRTRSGVLLCAFLNIFDEKISWDYQKQEPLPDMKRFTWLARSFDDGATWPEVEIVQKGYCGALRDMIQTSTGEIALVGQDVANNPGRSLSFTHVSTDDGKTWMRSNVMDIGGRGDHAGSIEGTIEELRDGRLWILLRSYHGHFYECFSSDKGRTWTGPVASKIKASGSPGLLKRLASGRLVLLWNRYAENRPKQYGRREELSMAFSEDDGKTWTEPAIVVRLRGKRQSYPQAFERRPGELWISTWQGGQMFNLFEKDFIGGTKE